MKPPQPVTPRIPVAKPATREAKTRLQNPHVLGKGYCLTWCVNGGKRQHLALARCIRNLLETNDRHVVPYVWPVQKLLTKRALGRSYELFLSWEHSLLAMTDTPAERAF